MTQEEIQKQIEAVRGLIETFDSIRDQDTYDIDREKFWRDTEKLQTDIRNLTQTLKPYLNGEKLEV